MKNNIVTDIVEYLDYGRDSHIISYEGSMVNIKHKHDYSRTCPELEKSQGKDNVMCSLCPNIFYFQDK